MNIILVNISFEANSLDLRLDTKLRFSNHISNIIRKTCINLKLLYNRRFWLSEKLKHDIYNNLVLSHFNHCDAVYNICLDVNDSLRIPRLQNSCLRFIYGIRKYNHILGKLKDGGWLHMKLRRELHSLRLYHKIATL